MRRKKNDTLFSSSTDDSENRSYTSESTPTSLFSITAPYFNTSSSFLPSKLFEIFSLDNRSLCAFRILLGFTVIYDILDRFTDLTAHYTDEGVHSRATAMEEMSWVHTSINLASGEKWFQGMIFLITLLAGFLIMIGFYTKTATLICWYLIGSIQSRNQSVLHCGDDLLRLLLFFAFFTPIQKLWSIDSVLKKWSLEDETRPSFSSDDTGTNETDDEPKKFFSNVHKEKYKGEDHSLSFLTMGGILLLTQVLITYATAFFHKSGEEWRIYGTATWYSLHLSYFARGPALILINLPFICKLLTFSVLYWQLLGPIIYFSPFLTQWCKMLVGVGFFTMHASFALCFRLDMFNWVTISASLILIPPLFWDFIVPLILKPATPNRGVCLSYPTDNLPVRFLVILYEVFGGTKTIVRPFKHYDEGISSSGETPTPTPATYNSTPPWLEVDRLETKTKLRDVAGIVLALQCSPWLWPLASVFSSKLISGIIAFYFWMWEYSPFLGPDPSIQAWKRKYKFSSQRIWRKRIGKYLTNLFLAFTLILLLVTNYYDIIEKAEPSYTRTPLYLLRLDQSWNMFSPRPPDSDFWYQIQLTLKNKTMIDVFSEGGIYDWKQPSIPLKNPRDKGANAPKPDVSIGIKNHRWFKFFENGLNDEIDRGDVDTMRNEFAGWLCRMYNAANRMKAKYITMYLCSEGFDAKRPSSPPKRLSRQIMFEFECAI